MKIHEQIVESSEPPLEASEERVDPFGYQNKISAAFCSAIAGNEKVGFQLLEEEAKGPNVKLRNTSWLAKEF